MNKLALYNNRDWLYNQYIKNRLSSIQIAKICDVAKPTILRHMRKFGIPRRTHSDAQSGRLVSDVTREKMRLAQTGRKHTEETKQKLRERGFSKEHRQRIREARLEWFKNNSNPTKGMKRSDQTKYLISQRLTGKKRTLQVRQDKSKWAKEFYKNNPHPCKGRTHSEELKKHWSRVHRKRWSNPEFAKKSYAASQRKPTNPEIFFNDLTPLNVKYVGDFSWWRQLPNGKNKNPDFIVLGQNRVIEIFGDYWHRNDDPQALINLYNQAGLECLIIWESELYADPQAVLNKTLDFIEV